MNNKSSISLVVLFLLLVLLSFVADATSSTSIRAAVPPKIPSLASLPKNNSKNDNNCQQINANGSRNGEECYSVDISTCQYDNTGNNADCPFLYGSYSYYLQSDGTSRTRLDLWPVAVAVARSCYDVEGLEPFCAISIDINNEVSLSWECTFDEEDSIVYFDPQGDPDALEYFPAGEQAFVFGVAEGEYLKIIDDPNHCEWLQASLSLNPSSIPSSLVPLSSSPSFVPSSWDSISDAPSLIPSLVPSLIPSLVPSLIPSLIPSTIPSTPEEVCEESNVGGRRNEDECYSVDSVTCQSSTDGTNGSCIQLQGTYDYYLKVAVSPRVNLMTVLVTADTCSSSNDCTITATLDGSDSSREFPCTIDGDDDNKDMIISFDPQDNDQSAIYRFGDEPQEFVFGGGHLQLRYDESNCQHYSGEENCMEDNANGSRNGDECFSVDATTCFTPANDNDSCAVSAGGYDYYLAPDNGGQSRVNLFTVFVTVQDCGSGSFSCSIQVEDHNSNIMTFSCTASSNNNINDEDSTITVYFDPANNDSQATGRFGDEPQQFVMGEGYLKLRDDPDHCAYVTQQSGYPTYLESFGPSNVPSLVQSGYPTYLESFGPSIVPSMVPSLVPSSSQTGGSTTSCYMDQNIPCYDPETSSGYDCGHCYQVDITKCVTDNGNGCVETEASYNYGPGNPTIKVVTSVGCQNDDDDYYCAMSIGDDITCDQCVLEDFDIDSPLDQKMTILESCSDVFPDYLPAKDQLIWLSEGVGYVELLEDSVICQSEVPSIVPSTYPSLAGTSNYPSTYPSLAGTSYSPSGIGFSSAPSDGGPSFVPSFVDTSSATSQYPSGQGIFSCYDSFAEGEANDGDCFAVDIGICYEEFGDGSCVHTRANYEYYNLNQNGKSRDSYGYISISSNVGCGNSEDDDSCTISGAGSCGSCTVFGEQVILEDCSDFFREPTQSISLSEGGGYPLLTNSDNMCSSNAPSAPTQATAITKDYKGGSSSTKKGGDNTLVLRIKPHFTLNFFDGHKEDTPPESTEILILLERTKQYIWDILEDEYRDLLLGIQVDDIQKSYKAKPPAHDHEFELSFTARILFHVDAIVKSRIVSDHLTDSHNLKDFVGNYARYADEDGTQPNGLFHYTNVVKARISGISFLKSESLA